jgi:hypothetical protein
LGRIGCAVTPQPLLPLFGHGITVAGTPQQGAVTQRVRDLLDFARHHGYKPDEIVKITKDLG